MENSLQILTILYTRIMSLVDGNISGVVETAINILKIMMTIDLVMSIVFHLEEDTLMIFIKKIMPYGFYYYIIKNFVYLKKQILEGFLWIGQKIGGGGTSFDFSNMMSDSLTSCTAIMSGVNNTATNNLTDWSLTDVIYAKEKIQANISLYIVGLILCLAIVIIMGVLIIEMMMAMIEFQLTSVISIMLLPFGVNSKTKFIADKSFSAIINSGIKISIQLAIFNLINQYLMVEAIDINDTATLIGYFLSVLMMLMLAKRSDKIAQSFLHAGGSTGGHVDGMVQGAKQLGQNIMKAMSHVSSGGATAGAEAGMKTGTAGVSAIEKASNVAGEGKTENNMSQAFTMNNNSENNSSMNGYNNLNSNIENNASYGGSTGSNDNNSSNSDNKDNENKEG